MGDLGQQRSPFSVCAKRQKFWLMAASALAPLSMGVSQPALAQCAGPASNTVCNSAGNSYPTGINVDATGLVNGFSTGINLTLQPAVKVDIPPAQAALTQSTPLIARA